MSLPRVSWLSRLALPMRELGPYAAIALLLPGGSLIAVSLWALRHRSWLTNRARVLALAALPGAMLPGWWWLPAVHAAAFA
jgi:hypothetical protein